MTRTIGLLSVIFLFCITGCRKDQKIKEALEATDSTGSKSGTPSNARVAYGTDGSGTVQIVIITQETTGAHPQTDVAVPQDYVLIGGGAVVTPELTTGAGALLTASYPDDNLTTWHAASKDHLTSFNHTLVAYAIGLKLTGVTRDQLKSYMQVFSNTSGSGQHPTTSVSVGSGYTLIGGGAKVVYSGAGNMLVKSMPLGDTWYAGSKDHDVASSAVVTSYAIGIKTAIPNFGNLEIGQESNSNFVPSGFGVVTVNIDNSWVLACPGAQAFYNNAGRMLTAIEANIRDVKVTSKDHKVYDGGTTYAYAVKIRKQQ
ncbi:hypothetical protein SAMN05518672_103454 [Chitinophaga sp. CF118]|uniref:hypothetical protein n=1 Tax=Chitinophaga sp. CF118 TaxID=1884367 RepID=UPI0008E8BE6B|nr:hypothetical protein [Chitinophaga sp. CF118]SFD84009.1 hypothetical protein SAMN05518672_103454 [Chitinophaga sp. CF118]